MSTEKHRWEFAPRFRRGSFGWRSQPAIARLKEAVAEIRSVARRDRCLGAEGAIFLLEKLSPALEQVDSSSGAIGTAVNSAIDVLVPIIGSAPADDEVRHRWLERLWDAVEDDDIPYIELLTDYWGELCATPAVASEWADRLIGAVRMAWSGDPVTHGYFKGTSACLSSLYRAGRNEELMALVERAPYPMWDYHRWRVKALCALGRQQEALRYAEESRGVNDNPYAIARACEEILLADGQVEEAYRRYGFEANRKGTYLATFRAIAQKYPQKCPEEILHDLAASSPGEEGKWFAAAKSAGLLAEALELAQSSPCDPRTLTRAARDLFETNPSFAIEAGLTALRWLVEGYGYDITAADVWGAYSYVMKAAEVSGRTPETLERVRQVVSREVPQGFVTEVLGSAVGVPSAVKV